MKTPFSNDRRTAQLADELSCTEKNHNLLPACLLQWSALSYCSTRAYATSDPQMASADLGILMNSTTCCCYHIWTRIANSCRANILIRPRSDRSADLPVEPRLPRQ